MSRFPYLVLCIGFCAFPAHGGKLKDFQDKATGQSESTDQDQSDSTEKSPSTQSDAPCIGCELAGQVIFDVVGKKLESTLSGPHPEPASEFTPISPADTIGQDAPPPPPPNISAWIPKDPPPDYGELPPLSSEELIPENPDENTLLWAGYGVSGGTAGFSQRVIVQYLNINRWGGGFDFYGDASFDSQGSGDSLERMQHWRMQGGAYLQGFAVRIGISNLASASTVFFSTHLGFEVADLWRLSWDDEIGTDGGFHDFTLAGALPLGSWSLGAHSRLRVTKGDDKVWLLGIGLQVAYRLGSGMFATTPSMP